MKKLIFSISLILVLSYELTFAQGLTAYRLRGGPVTPTFCLEFSTSSDVFWNTTTNTLNMCQTNTYVALSGGGGTGLLTLNGLTADPQTFATGTTGTNFNIVSSGSTHTFNFPDASATNRGLLTSANWTTFNNKLSSLGGLTATSQTFAKVDDTNVTLTIGSSTSTHTFTLGWTGTLAKARQHASTAYIDQANTFGAFTQTFGGAISATQFYANGLVTGLQTGDIGASRSPTTGAIFLGTDGNMFLFRSAANTLHLGATNLLIFNVATASFPALKRSGTNLQVRLGDDSAFSDLEVADEVYNATTWDGNLEVATKNSLRDKIETLGGGLACSGCSNTIIPVFNGTDLVNSNLADGASGLETTVDIIDAFGNSVDIGSVSNPFNDGRFGGDVFVSDDVYDATGWNGNLEVPTKNAIRDKIESLGGGSGTVSSATANQVAYYTAATTISGDAGYTYDPATDTLTVGTLITTNAGYTNFPSQTDSTTEGDFWRNSDLFKFRGAAATFTFATLEANNVWADGVKQTFNPNGTNAGLNVGSQAGDPSSLANGDVWYDSTNNTLDARINGATVSLGAGGGGGTTINATDTIIPYRSNSTTFTDSNLTHVTAGVRLPNAKFLVGRNAADSADFNILGIDANNRAVFPDLKVAFGDGFRDNAAFPKFSLSTIEWDWAAGGHFRWSNDANDFSSAKDSGILRAGAGILRVSDGSTGIGALTSKRQLQDKTASYTVLVTESNGVLTNTGAAGAITYTLPTPVVGLSYTFITGAAQVLNITTTTPASEEIIDAGTADANDILASAATRGISVTVVAISSTSWVIISKTGTWS